MVPKAWKVQAISEVLEKVSIPVLVKADEIYQEIGIRSHGKGIFHKEPITGKRLGDKRVFHIEPECLVVNIVFAWEQAVAKTSDSEIGMIASHRFPMFRPIKSGCNIDFILYLFKTKFGKYLLELASPGGAGRNKTLGQSEFLNLELTLPPVEEQKKIAQILSTWDRAIATTEKLLENSQRQKQALMQQLLTGKKRFSEFSENWNIQRLENVCQITMGSSPSSNSYNENLNGLPLVQGNADIFNRVTRPRVYTSEITKQCKVGDVLLSVRAPVGTVAKSAHNACIGRGVASIRAKNGHEQEYIYQSLLWFEQRWEKYSQGSTFESINRDDIKSLRIEVPLINEQQKIASVLNLADKEIHTLESKLNSLREEKEALMQQLLTGKHRVKVEH